MRKLQRKLKVSLTSIPKLSIFLLAPVVAIITYLEGSTANIYTFMWIHICIHRKIFSVVFIYRKGNTVNNTFHHFFQELSMIHVDSLPFILQHSIQLDTFYPFP